MDDRNCMLSDDELSVVNGGTAEETDELTALLGVDRFSLNDALKAYGVSGTALFSSNSYANMYTLEGGGTITHTELIRRIKESKGLL